MSVGPADFRFRLKRGVVVELDVDHRKRIPQPGRPATGGFRPCVKRRSRLRHPSRDSEPYVKHLFRVLRSVRGAEAQTVAVLHDVLEGRPVTVDDVREVGVCEDIVKAIVALTRSPDQTCEQYIERVARDDLARLDVDAVSRSPSGESLPRR